MVQVGILLETRREEEEGENLITPRRVIEMSYACKL